jgi:hypothetical protein
LVVLAAVISPQLHDELDAARLHGVAPIGKVLATFTLTVNGPPGLGMKSQVSCEPPAPELFDAPAEPTDPDNPDQPLPPYPFPEP